jgi:hypothetical protein
MEMKAPNTKECLLSIKTALRLRKLLKESGQFTSGLFLCSYCRQPVRAESGTSAHFEHLKRNINCPLSEKSKAKQLYRKHKDDKAKKRLAAAA